MQSLFTVQTYFPDSVQTNPKERSSRRTAPAQMMSLSPLGKVQSVSSAVGCVSNSLLGVTSAQTSTGFSVTDILSPLDDYGQKKSSITGSSMSLDGSGLPFTPYRSAGQSVGVQPNSSNPYLTHCAATGFGSHSYQTPTAADFSTYAAAAAATNHSAGWYGASHDPRFGSMFLSFFLSFCFLHCFPTSYSLHIRAQLLLNASLPSLYSNGVVFIWAGGLRFTCSFFT